MSVVKILRNVSGASKQVRNRTIANNESFTIPHNHWLDLANDTDIQNAVTSGLIVVNDGNSDLSISEGLELLQRFQFDSAEKISFNNASNGFESENAQAAIEEARQTATSLSRFGITTTFNSTVGNNQWLGYSELLPGNTTPIIIPRNCKLKEITFSWSSTITILLGLVTLSSDVDGTFNLYKNGTSSGDIIWSKVFSNASGGAVSPNIDINLNAGDFIIGRWVDQGSNPSDMAICYFFQPI